MCLHTKLSCFKLLKHSYSRVLCAIKRSGAPRVLYRIKLSYSCFEYYLKSYLPCQLIDKVIFKINLVQTEKIKTKVDVNQSKSLADLKSLLRP